MPAISDDTAALVAAQLTQAWATIFAANPGAGGMHDPEISGRVAKVYTQFRNAVREVDIKPSGFNNL